MPLIARASNTVRNKNLLLVGMCAVMLALFAYDGWQGYPNKNDLGVKALGESPQVDSAGQQAVRAWKGWIHESPENREKMDAVVARSKSAVKGLDHWKTTGEIMLQRWIALGLLFVNAAAVWWYMRCQRRRAIADDQTLSPAPGVVIPWEKITRIDNTRWDKVGIVDLTYTDEAGKSAKAKLDDYETQRKPLLEILDLLSEKAVNAEVYPKVEAKEKDNAAAAGGESSNGETKAEK